jgi:ComF family protein
VLRELLALVLPPACAGCGRPVAETCALCAACDARLPRLAAPLDPRPPPPLAARVAVVAFSGDAEAWIHRFKYPGGALSGLDPRPEAVIRALAREAARAAPAGFDRLVPVPQHPRRLRARGFNPAGSIAREIARATGVALDVRALARVRHGPSQTGLDRAARRRNVAGAFRARGAVAGCVALVDDVTTTGATLAEAARALAGAGARRVIAICLARTL